MNHLENNKGLLALFFVIFVDVLGMCIVFPVLAPLIYASQASFIGTNISLSSKNWIYGFLLALWPLSMFFSAPILGNLSDKFGRKKIILLCLSGEMIAYLLGAVSIMAQSLSIMVLSRIISGVFAGSQPIAQAAIADISTSQNKVANMSKIVLASSLGVVLGPLIGGFSADRHFSFLGYATPFLIATVIAWANIVLLWIFFKETHVVNNTVGIKWLKAVNLFTDAFKCREIRITSLVFFAIMLSWSVYFQNLSYFLIHRYQATTGNIGMFYAVIGAASAFMLGYGIRALQKKITKEYLVYLIGLVMLITAGIIAALSHWIAWQYLASILGAAGIAITYTLSLCFYSNAVGEGQQGWIMGISSAIAGVSWGITAGALGLIDGMSPIIGFVVMSLTALVGLGIVIIN